MPTREGHAALTHLRLQPERQRLQILLHGALSEDRLQTGLVACAPHQNIIGERARDRERALRHDADGRGPTHLTSSDHSLTPRSGKHRALTAAHRAHEGDKLARVHYDVRRHDHVVSRRVLLGGLAHLGLGVRRLGCRSSSCGCLLPLRALLRAFLVWPADGGGAEAKHCGGATGDRVTPLCGLLPHRLLRQAEVVADPADGHGDDSRELQHEWD